MLPVPEPQPAIPSVPPVPGGARWQWLPVPAGPDRHAEWFASTVPAGLGALVVGARARGRKHKQEGTNCDDWFELVAASGWTFIAVSDGAGSRRFSRVGARAACAAAVDHLSSALARAAVDGDAGPETARTRRAVQGAMSAGRAAVDAALQGRVDDPEYAAALGRSLTLDDLSCTLLVTAHWTDPARDDGPSHVVSCQVGDGITGCVDVTGKLVLLGQPDSGEYSGETEFLTSGRIDLSPEGLESRTFAFTGGLRTLVSMTDGVSDVYFPDDPHLLRLEADLVLNGVLPRPEASVETMSTALAATRVCSLDALRSSPPAYGASSCDERGERIVSIRTMQRFAKALELDWSAIARQPHLLAAACADVDQEVPVEERLRLWLDAFQVRGEFDDRTLVVLHRGWRDAAASLDS